VGEGKAYKGINVRITAPVKNMPSGGMIPGGWIKNLWKDLSSGLGRLMFDQIASLRKLKKEVSMVVAVGDTFPVILGGLFTGKPLIFVGTAKSDYFYPYSAAERKVFRKYCRLVFPRDEITAESLRKAGINAKWVGNAMMDNLGITDERFGIPEDKMVIALLPGSRDFAYADFPILLEAAILIDKSLENKPAYIAPLADSIELCELEKCAQRANFHMNQEAGQDGLVARLIRNNVEILLIRNRFGNTIDMAKIVIGQAGTGNEQAVGLGKPVVSFDSAGSEKLGWYRLRQKGLLGDSLAITRRDSEDVAIEALDILNNQQKYDSMAKIGIERLGPPGGAGRMAEAIYQTAKEFNG
jgi:uncharacterized protein (TIGR03492 family)